MGHVQIQDILFTSIGPTKGLVTVEWNMNADAPGSAAMWGKHFLQDTNECRLAKLPIDSHVRIGGALGTNLQVSECPSVTSSVKDSCIAGSLMFHLTSSASAYLSNVWLWTADHDLDEGDPVNTQVSVYNARGMLIESQNPVWLYGTASEHSVLYQYQFYHAKNVLAGMIQTESPYYQPVPSLPAPFADAVGAFKGDPSCIEGGDRCGSAWALRIVESSDVIISGAGLYSWFDAYVQVPCVDDQDCQSSMVQIENTNGNVSIFNLITIGATTMVSDDSIAGAASISAADNMDSTGHPYWSLITVFQPVSVPEDGSGDGGSDVYVPPEIWSSTTSNNVQCLPPCTIVLPPYQLSTTTIITWPALTTTLLSLSNSDTYTKTTTISIGPLTTTEIEFWAITIQTTDPTVATFVPVQSVMPKSFILTLPGTEATFPPTLIRTGGSIPTAISSSSSSSGAIIVPVFYTTSHPITIQPQPTVSIETQDHTPPVLVPTVTFSSAKPKSTCKSQCGHHDCGIFGCGGGCGLFGCSSGCGIFGCGGGCGLFGCPGNCPLLVCGGLGCIGGHCGIGGCPSGDCSTWTNPNEDADCTELMTATICTKAVSSFIPDQQTTYSTTTKVRESTSLQFSTLFQPLRF